MKKKLTSLPQIHSGKVGDVYQAGGFLLLLRSDRGSGLNVKLTTEMPGKGIILNTLSKWWMENPLKDIIPNHLTGIPLSNFLSAEDEVIAFGRAEIVKKLEPILVEAVVRRHLTGTAFKDYQKTGEVCGIKLPPGLKDGDRLSAPIFTPTEKSERDPPITFCQMCERIGPQLSTQILETSLKIFEVAEKHLLARGIILADTKFEFGLDNDGTLTLMDEVLTPDSSRFWVKEVFDRERRIVSLDKQKIRDRMQSQKDKGLWDGVTPFALPDSLTQEVIDDYRRIYNLIVGNSHN